MTEETPGFAEDLRKALRHVNKWGAAEFSKSELERAAEEFLAGAVAQRWMEKQAEQTSIRAMEFRNGASMELEPAREILAMWVGACRGLIGDAPNYSETPLTILAKPDDKVSMDVKLAETPTERYTITIQRDHPDAITPHQARQRAEEVIEKVWKWIVDVNDGAGRDTDDLISILERAGFSPPPEEEEEEL